MDRQTINVYDRESDKIALLHSKLIPERLYQIIQQFFIKDGKTLDIGCGMGRDTAWLSNHGFPAIGVDASKGMLEQAVKYYKNLNLIQDKLPELASIVDNSFQNILCSAVLMHLNYESLLSAVINFLRLLKNNGIIIISFRCTKSMDRCENEKLYEKINSLEIISWFEENRGKLIFYESSIESERNHLWYNLVFKKQLCLED